MMKLHLDNFYPPPPTPQIFAPKQKDETQS